MSNQIVLPILPLNGTILFPESSLPLNIFEQRYLDMIDFALSSNKRIGMIQTKDNGKLYKIGCIGKIIAYEETNDGRYLINIIGEHYFKIINEKKTRQLFRTVEVDKFIIDISFKNIKLKDQIKTSLIKKYINFIESTKFQVDISFLKKIDTPSLIKFIAMSSPFGSAEKQMLLETYQLDSLTTKLISLFDYYNTNQQNNKTLN